MESEEAVEYQEVPLIDDIDLSSLFEDYPDGFNLDDFDFVSPYDQQTPSPFSLSSFEDVEKFLMDDGDEAGIEFGGGGDGFGDALLSDLLADGSGCDSAKSEVDTPVSGRSVENEAEKLEEVEEREGDDPVSKKQRRQMRNKESAMKSRERKKVYVKELEMKSKYLESECRRLNYALQCCMAENVALQQRMHMERSLGAPAAKQESAVLFMESLLLGSVFWLVSIVCLFLVPGLNLEVESNKLGRGPILENGRSKTVVVNENFGHDLVIMRRRCRGMRTRMKSFLLPFLALFA